MLRRSASGRHRPSAAMAWGLAAALCLLLPMGATSAEAEAERSWTAYARDARVELKLGNLELAESLYLESLEAAERNDPRGIRTATALGNLENLIGYYQLNGLQDDFIRLSELTIDASERIQGRVAARDRIQLAKIYVARKLYEQAEVHYQKVIEAQAAGQEIDAVLAFEARAGIANIRVEQEQYEEAETYLLQAREVTEASGREDRALVMANNELAWFYVERGRSAEAVPLARRAVEVADALHLQPAEKLGLVDTLALALRDTGELDESVALYREALDEPLGADPPPRIRLAYVEIYDHFASALRADGRAAEANELEYRIQSAERTRAMRGQLLEDARAGMGSIHEGRRAPAPRADEHEEEILQPSEEILDVQEEAPEPRADEYEEEVLQPSEEILDVQERAPEPHADELGRDEEVLHPSEQSLDAREAALEPQKEAPAPW